MPTTMLLPGHDVPIGRHTTVRRLLPQRPRRMVGAWCFVDHFGPDDVSTGPGMTIGPHPHTGLQTVTWLVDGEILHRDSLGNEQTIYGGQLNLMTAGRGIAHSEESPAEHPPLMHGLQLWVALPGPARHTDPAFDHHPDLPVVQVEGASITVVVGECLGVRSPARVFTPLLGADIVTTGPATVSLPAAPGFEYGLLAMTGTARVGDDDLVPGALLYLGEGRTEIELRTAGPARLFLLGGEPFDEPLVMWWNFVGRSHEDVAEARADWMAGVRFGEVRGYDGERLPAPAMVTTRIKPRDRHGHTTTG